MTFTEASERFELYRWMFSKSKLEKQKYLDLCRALIVPDRRGLKWTIHPDDGNWYFYDGHSWTRGAPDYTEDRSAPVSRPPAQISFWRRFLVFVLNTSITAAAGWLLVSSLAWLNHQTIPVTGGNLEIIIPPLLIIVTAGIFSLLFGWLINWIMGKLILNPKRSGLVVIGTTGGIISCCCLSGAGLFFTGFF